MNLSSAFDHLSVVIDVPSVFSPKLSWVGIPRLSWVGVSYGLIVKLLAGYIILLTPSWSIKETLT